MTPDLEFKDPNIPLIRMVEVNKENKLKVDKNYSQVPNELKALQTLKPQKQLNRDSFSSRRSIDEEKEDISYNELFENYYIFPKESKKISSCMSVSSRSLLEKSKEYNSRGFLELKNGCWERAVKSWKLALNFRRAVYGDINSSVADIKNNIGVAMSQLGRPDIGISILHDALRLRLVLNGELHLKVSQIYHNIGNFEKSRGNFEKAILKYSEALSIKRALGVEGVETGLELMSIGHVYYERQLFEKAFGYYETSFNIYQEAGISETHPRMVELQYKALNFCAKNAKIPDEARSSSKNLNLYFKFSTSSCDFKTLFDTEAKANKVETVSRCA